MTTWGNLFFLLLLSAGHAEVQVAVLNRVYSRRIQCRQMRWLRVFHDLMIPAFPVIAVIFVGFRSPGLLTGGEWADVAVGWMVVFAICGLGLAGLFWSMMRWLMLRPPAMQQSNHTRVVDLAETLSESAFGDGRYRFLARLPRNEILQLEVTERTLQHPRWPTAWDALSVLHLSDLHYEGTLDIGFFREVMTLAQEMNPHLIAFTGDLLDRKRLAKWLPETLGTLNAPLGRYFVLGNHDWYLRPDEIREAMTAIDWRDVAGQSVALSDEEICRVLGMERTIDDKRSLIIGGDERPWMGTAPDFSETPHNEFRILLSHTPDNLGWARRHDVDLMFSGHNHGGQIVFPVIGPVYSPSRHGVKYAGGLFWREPTLLHVSRGISGRQPIRWNCRPEITKFVLYSESASATPDGA